MGRVSRGRKKTFADTKLGKNKAIANKPVVEFKHKEKPINTQRRDEEIFNRLWRKNITEEVIAEAQKKYKNVWEGYDLMTTAELKEQFRFEVLDDAKHKKKSITNQFKTFLNSAFFISSDERYVHKVALQFKKYGGENAIEFAREALGCDISEATTEYLGDGLVKFTGTNNKALIITPNGSISPKDGIGSSLNWSVELV